jgi:hypothetical protein
MTCAPNFTFALEIVNPGVKVEEYMVVHGVNQGLLPSLYVN